MTTQELEALELQVQEGEQKKMASGLHGVLSMRIGRHLANFVEERKLGYVLDSSTTYNFQDNQPKRQPDVSFVSLKKMPEPLDEELTFAPDLAVEVVSKNDGVYEVESKITQYQQAGVKLIWIVRPVRKVVEVYRQSQIVPMMVGVEGELDGEDVLPGFKLSVKTLFE